MSAHTKAALQRNNNPLVWVALIAAGLFFIPPAIFSSVWLNLISVNVHDTPWGSDPVVDVRRDIHMEFYGRYSVVIRDAETERFVCQGTPASPFTYRPDEEQEMEVTLSWWLGSAAQLAACYHEGLRPGGSYFVDTCHYAIGPYGVDIARRCVLSNTFTLHPIQEE